MARILQQISYKPNVELNLREGFSSDRNLILLRATYDTIDSTCRPHFPPISIQHQHMLHSQVPFSEEGFVRQVYEILKRAEIHELDEFFRYRGELLFDPHASDR